MSPVTVATSTDAGPVAMPFQRKGFYAAGRFWAFYSDDTNAVYKSTTNPADWSGSATSIGACIDGARFSVWFDGTYIHYVRYDNYDLFYRRGVPESDGSITWSAVEQTVYDGTSSDYYRYPCIAVDDGGYAWIGVRHYGPPFAPYALKNSENDGTWTMDFATALSALAESSWRVCPVPLTSAKVYVIYCRTDELPLGNLWNGAAWVGEENDLADLAIEDSTRFSAVADGDDVHFVYNRMGLPYQIRYNIRTFGVGWGAADVLVQDDVTMQTAPALSIDTATSDLYCFWTSTVTDHVYYKKYSSGSWDAGPTDWINESVDEVKWDFNHSSYYQDHGDYIGLLYTTKLASPYNVKFDFLSFVPPPPLNTYRVTIG